MDKESLNLQEPFFPATLAPVGVESTEINFELYDRTDEGSSMTHVFACKTSIVKTMFFSLISITLLPLLLIKWSSRIKRFLLYSYTRMQDATHLFISDSTNTYEIVPIESVRIQQKDGSYKFIKRIMFRFFPYYYDEEFMCWFPIKFSYTKAYTTIHASLTKGMREPDELQNAQALFGPCQINVPYKGIWGIFVDEILSPFYLFQVASVILWMLDTYYYYAFAILFLTIISATAEIYETRRNLLNIRKMALYECEVSILRTTSLGPSFVTLSSSQLVPGDIIELSTGSKMPCDCVLLSGTCIVNEAMLTGESIPVMKSALPCTHDIYNPDEDKKYTVYSGTEIIQARCSGDTKVCALVVRTGFTTVKGSLVRYVLYPKPSKFKFYTDSYKFIAVMFCLSFIGMAAQFFNGRDIPTSAFIKKSLDLITVTVPPALPACMSIGASFALSRLKKKLIYCISPQRINVAGKVNVMCFDKTGTLTEDGLSIYGFRVSTMKSAKVATFKKFKKEVKGLHIEGMYESMKEYEEKKGYASALFVEALASCHSLTRVNGKIIGDPLDIEMFNASGWILDEPEATSGDPAEIISTYVMPNIQQKYYDWSSLKRQSSPYPYQLGIVRRFDFSSKLQRMSVIVQNLRDLKYKLYTKGAPERMKELCRPTSIPHNFSEVLARYTKKGYRVLAIGTRQLNINYQQCQKVNRDLIEQKLIFIGFLILQNKLKPTTVSVISQLHSANLRTIMLTGDNPYTAISVAKECGIVPQNDAVMLGDYVDGLHGGAVRWIEVSKTKKLVAKKGKAKHKNYSVKLNMSNASVDSRAEDCIPRQMSDSLELEMERVSKTFANTKSGFKKDHEEIEDEVVAVNIKDATYAVTGKAIDHILEKDPFCNRRKTKKLLSSISVYARMSPDSKARLVEALQKLGNIVGMCGDGANDCAALKAADAGISLSEAEASIAAPFTSKTPDISCVIKLLREGRAALATSFQCFKFMALYSIIQLVSVSILYSLKINLTDMQFLMIDLFMILPIAVTMSWTKAARGLARKMPNSDLLSVPVLASIIGQAMLQCLFQILFYIYTTKQTWYIPPLYHYEWDDNDTRQKQSHANTAVYLFASMQYVATVVAFSIGKPFRKPMYTNLYFTLNVLALILFNFYSILMPGKFVIRLLDFDYENYKKVPESFYVVLAVIAVVNSAATYLYEIAINTWLTPEKYKEE